MKYCECGGLRLSRMMLGTVQLGMPYGMANRKGQPSLEESFALLDTARAEGVNCVDTARHYGESERVLGAYCKSRPGHGCTLVTKFKIDPALGTSAREIEAQLTQSLEDSLARLGLAQIPVYLAHRAEDITQYGQAVPKTLARFREKGLVGHLGLSVYHTAQIDAMLQHGLFDAVQLPMNLLDVRPLQAGALERLARAGGMVFVRSVFLQGMFFVDELPKEFGWAKPQVAALQNIARDEGCSMAQLALSFVRDLPGVHCLVLGAETPEQVRENAALVASSPLASHTRSRIMRLAQDFPVEKLMEDIITWTRSKTTFKAGA